MFKSEVAVFDGHAVIGKSHDEQMETSCPEKLLKNMDEIGIEQALVYHRDAISQDTADANEQMMRMLEGHTRLTPQHIVNMAADDPARFIGDDDVRAVRVFPNSHGYSFSLEVTDKWMTWLEDAEIALWVSADEVGMRDLYHAAKAYPGVALILSGMQNHHLAALWRLIPRIPNLHIELSRLENASGVRMMVDRAGARRLIFGSYYPDFDPAAYLAYLHQCRLSDNDLRSICHGNLIRLLDRGRPLG